MKEKEINTFSFENLFCINKKNQRQYYKERRNKNIENKRIENNNEDKEKNIKNIRCLNKEEEIMKNEEEKDNKKQIEEIKINNNENIENKNILILEKSEILNQDINIKEVNENINNDNLNILTNCQKIGNNKKRITISNEILIEEINTSKPVAEINITKMFLKKKSLKKDVDNSQVIITKNKSDIKNNKKYNKYYINNKNNKDKNEKSIFLFGFDDKNNFLQFDLRKKKFIKKKISELEDLSDIFEKEYIYQNTILYNILNGVFILTGKNTDILFFYNSINETIIKVCQFNSGHQLGCLLLDQENNRIFILGGKNTNLCESYSFDDQKINEIPNLNFDRANASYIISNNKIFGFFGFSFKKGKYICNIEYIDKNKLDKWDIINLNFDFKKDSLPFHLRNISTFNYENEQNRIIIYGGKQGKNETVIDGYYYVYEVDKNKFEKMEGLYYNIIKDLKSINIWKNSELIDALDKNGFYFDKQKQIIELPEEDKIIDGYNIYTSVIIDSENNIHYLTNNQKYITVYKYITK